MALELFEQATKEKVRFDTNKGSIDVEDLWDMPLTSAKNSSLDSIAKKLSRMIKEGDEESFVETAKADPTVALAKFKLEVVKRVIAVRLEENNKAKMAADRKAKKARIMEIMAEKQDDSLKQASAEELQKMLDELDA